MNEPLRVVLTAEKDTVRDIEQKKNYEKAEVHLDELE